MGHATGIYNALARMAVYDPEGRFEYRVLDTERGDEVPALQLAIAGLHRERTERYAKLLEKDKVDWVNDGF